MEQFLILIPCAVFVVSVHVGIRLFERRRLRKAVETQRAAIEAFAREFDVETSCGGEAIVSIHRRRGPEDQEIAVVYLKGGGWFQLSLLTEGDQDWFSISIRDVGGRSLEHFPPLGTRYGAIWFVTDMTKILQIIDVWPRPWTRPMPAVVREPDPHRPAHAPT